MKKVKKKNESNKDKHKTKTRTIYQRAESQNVRVQLCHYNSIVLWVHCK